MNFRRTIKLVHQLTGVTRPFPAVHGAKGARIEGKEDKVHRASCFFHPLHLPVFLHLPFILQYWTNHICLVENGENSIQNSIHRDFLSIHPSIHPSRFLTPTNKQNNREESATRWMTSRVPSSLFYLRIRSRGTTVFDKSRNGFATRSTLLSLSLSFSFLRVSFRVWPRSTSFRLVLPRCSFPLNHSN